MGRNAIEGIVAGIFAVWLGWISWEVVGIKSDHDVERRINAAVLELTKAIGTVSGNLNTEIERSKIKDTQGYNWLIVTSELANTNKGRIITLEVKQDADHGR